MPVSVLTLQQSSLFAQAPPALLAALAEQMDIVNLRRREVWMNAERRQPGLGVVLQGRMQALDHTLDGREVALIGAEAGQVFGHMDWLAATPTRLTWAATATSTLAWLPQARAQMLMDSAVLCLALARHLAQQLSDQLAWQKLLAVTPIGARVCAWLLWQDGQDQPPLTHAELAWRLNTTRESVTRTLQRMQTDGWIARDGDGWLLRDRQALLRAAQG